MCPVVDAWQCVERGNEMCGFSLVGIALALLVLTAGLRDLGIISGRDAVELS